MSERVNSIEVEGLVREFKKGPRAVDGIDLHVDPGEIYGFLGPNGAGKSTTVLMLTTLLPPTAGSARVGGYDVVKEGPKVRSVIGAALQEAALDPLLTGRDHVRLQATLQGLPRSERGQRADELLTRVGLSEAADRKVKGYSGGMKRRLDLALALVHRPSILFLDEPTTGLDPQSRTALWEEVARLARDDGVTVFLTTQYLEEADVLAGRVGIIDHGHIVAEGSPAELKAEIGLPSVHALPLQEADRARLAGNPGRVRRAAAGRHQGRRRPAARGRRRPAGGRPRDRRAEPAARPPRDPGPDARRRVPRQDRAVARGRRRAERHAARVVTGAASQVGALAMRSITRTARQPASAIPPLIFPVMLMAVNAAGLKPSTELPGFPTDSFLAFALAVPFIQGALFSTMNAGTDLARDIQTGFLNRLSLTSMRGSALIAGQLGGIAVLGLVQAVFYIVVGLLAGVHFASGVGGIAVLLLFAALVSVGFGAVGIYLALRTGSGEAIQGLFPLLFVFLFISSMNAPRNLMEIQWFKALASINPVSYLIEAVRSLIITGWDAQALALGFGFALVITVVGLVLASSALVTRLTRT